MERYFTKLFFAAGGAALLVAGCVPRMEMKSQRSQLISMLQHEMLANTAWLRVHAAEGLLDNGEPGKIMELFRPEADTATAPYRIGVWRVLARATHDDGERGRYIGRIRAVLHEPAAIDRISAAESLAKLNAASRADRDLIAQWLASADDATAAFPRWNLLLSSNASEREHDEAALANLLNSADPVARLRAAFALGRTKNLSSRSMDQLRHQLEVEPADSIARVYIITALMLHSAEPAGYGLTPYLTEGKANEQLEVGIALGLRGRAEDLKRLAPLLHSREPDARIGAANGMLHLLQ